MTYGPKAAVLRWRVIATVVLPRARPPAAGRLRASRCDIERLRILVEETRAARDSEAYRQADADFHRAIAEAARNALFLALFDALQALRQDETWERLGENGRCYKRQAVYAKDHREIFQAIAARDSERAQQAMYRHLSDVQRLLAE